MSSTERPPAVAGTFYPAAPRALADLVDALLAAARREHGERAPKALIVPHAGYVYSGAVAASGFALLAGAADRITRVVLLGPAHRAWVEGLAAPEATAFATPLGAAPVDVEALRAVPSVPADARAHAREHSLEVEIPFLQRLLPRARIVPLVIGGARPGEVGEVLERLWGGPETLVVVSSDLSHYLPYAEAVAVDQRTVARILALDPAPIQPEEACGCAGMNGLLWVARRKGLRPTLLDRRTSGDTAGDKDAVVGYASVAFHEEARDG